jgi:ABC-type transport system substrate-binding protein
MLFDRDPWIDAIFNVSAFQQQGLPITGKWHTHFAAGDPDYWTDPKTNELGEGAKYFQFNPAEAKKMLQAANFDFGKEWELLHTGTGGNQQQREVQILANFLLEQGGIKTRQESVPQTEAPQRVFQGGGTWAGIAINSGFNGGDLDQHLNARYIPGAGPTVLYSKVPSIPPEYNKYIDLLKKARMEPDGKKRIELIKNDVQKEMALQMPCGNFAGAAEGFLFAQPWVGNWGAWRTVRNVDPQELYINYWYDASKKTS